MCSSSGGNSLQMKMILLQFRQWRFPLLKKKQLQLVYQDMLIKPYILKAPVISSGSLILSVQSWAQVTFNDRRGGKRASTRVICNCITLLFPTCFSHSRCSSPILTRNPREVHAKGWNHVGHVEHPSSTALWTDWWRWLVVDPCGRHPWKGKSCL